MSTLHDVVRYLVRSTGHANTGVERDLLLAVDADEQGFPDLESYKETLAQKAREDAAANAAIGAAPAAPADVTAGISDDDLQAELDRRSALAAAQAGKRATKAPPKAVEA